MSASPAKQKPQGICGLGRQCCEMGGQLQNLGRQARHQRVLTQI